MPLRRIFPAVLPHVYRSFRPRQSREGPRAGNCSLLSLRPLMKKVVNLARGLRAYARNLGEIGQCRTFDRLQGSEMMKERALAAWADAGDFLQACFADIASSP